jgi:hypothetical protein
MEITMPTSRDLYHRSAGALLSVVAALERETTDTMSRASTATLLPSELRREITAKPAQ